MALRDVSLDDKYTLRDGRIFITGIQALVRLPMIQRDMDQAAGHNTAGYVSGYRGSPLGSLDQQMVRAKKQLTEKHVVFSPGVNEDLAATAMWGTQQGPMTGECRYDGGRRPCLRIVNYCSSNRIRHAGRDDTGAQSRRRSGCT